MVGVQERELRNDLDPGLASSVPDIASGPEWCALPVTPSTDSIMRGSVGRLCFLAAATSAGVVAAAGFAKLNDLAEFVHALKRWGIEPPLLRVVLAVLVPVTELTLGAAWLFSMRRRWATYALGILLVLLTLGYTAIVVQDQPAGCGCFGRLSRYLPMMEQPFMVYTRNVMLVMGLAWYAHRSKGAVRAGLDDGGRRAGSISGRARQIAGFTLLETLLSVLLVGVLAALLIPQVAGVNVKTRAAKVAAAMGGHAAVLTQYGSDYREVFPYLTDPRATLNVVRSESLNIAIECYYFDPAWCWHIG
ncbi:MAG: MauE/DoxX family redox-associated membrane protein, partial [Phycisphaerales bacterium]